MTSCVITTSQLIFPAIFQNVLVAKDGTPLTAGVIYFYRQADKTTLKNVYYQDGNGNFVIAPNPMTLSAAGTTVDVNGNDILLGFYPFLDNYPSCDPNISDLYFIEVYDQFGTLQFTRSNFPFNAEEAGPVGIVVPTFENYIINNRFWRNIGNQNPAPTGLSLATLTQFTNMEYQSTGNYYHKTLAPSQHDGFSMPDFQYIRDTNTSVTESVIFNTFPEQLAPPTIVDDIQPEFYVTHHCTADSSGSLLKVYQFPISLHIDTLASQPFTFTIQAMSTAVTTAAATIGIYIYQFVGTGGVSPVPQLIGTQILNSTWTKYTFAFASFPNNNNITLSGTGDDAYYLQIAMPTTANAVTTINFTLPSIYLSNSLELIPTNSFQTYDQIDSVIAAPRTGDVKISMSNFYPFGWIPLSGGTLTNPAVATTTPSTGIGQAYVGTDGWRLFELLWTHFKAYDTGANSNPIAQMYSAAGTATNYGATAAADWLVSAQISLSSMIGKVIMGTVPPLALPVVYSNTFTASQLTTSCAGSSGTLGLLMTSAQSVAFGEIVQFSGSLPTGIVAVTNYFCVPISTTTFYVATTLANAQNGVMIAWTDNGGSFNVINQSLLLTISGTPATLNVFRGQPITFTTTASLPGNLAINTVYYAVPTGNLTTAVATICIATSFANALSGASLVAYSSAGSGTNTVSATLAGTVSGEYAHSQYPAELATHKHTLVTTTFGNVGTSAPLTSSNATTPGAVFSGDTNYTGENVPMNSTQPSMWWNMLIKL